jgi:hypothetical protein
MTNNGLRVGADAFDRAERGTLFGWLREFRRTFAYSRSSIHAGA